MLALKIAFLAAALLGHAAFWVGVVNRWHATGFARVVVKTVTLAFYAALVVPVLAAGWYVLYHGLPSAANWSTESIPATAYLVLCAVYGAMHLVSWLWRRWTHDGGAQGVAEIGTVVVDIAQKLGAAPTAGPRAAVFGYVPGNQLFHMHVGVFAVEIPSLPPALDGFSICHWSDLHFCGRISPAYFEEVVRLTNDLAVDVLALTGDICDSARYIDWVPKILSTVRARAGKYFILGNHDLRTHDTPRVRQAMASAGFVDVAGRAEVIADGALLIAGNERPWFASEPSADDLELAPRQALRVLLAHTPDQLAWARSHKFDLMLAGHTHGGQVRFPFVGPVLCPSWHGVRYAGGFFHEPPTVLHVSRGTGSLFPLRFLCPPEITKLVLRAPRA
jgi:predicted MPP superfamily phosphohydrolase